VDAQIENISTAANQQCATLPGQLVATALREKPLLRELLATGAGYLAKVSAHIRFAPAGSDQKILIYCLRGGSRFELSGQLHPVRAGDALVLSACQPHGYRVYSFKPWTFYWAYFTGTNAREYLEELGVTNRTPVVRVGENLQLVHLFNELIRTLKGGLSYTNLLEASQTLGHLLAVLIRLRHQEAYSHSDNAHKVAQSIVYMSEHLNEPLRVATLASMANLSPTYFSTQFKEQTGCSPRDYLRLLRVHRACQLLNDTKLSVKEIAAKLGYQDQFHFSRQFKAFQGVSPSQFRGLKNG